jgi:uncharacterized membrane protein YfhO
LPDPKPYFETPSGVCTLQVQSRTSVTADCATAATLVRRELYYPGWNASIGGRPAAIAEFDGLFQAINLPSGRNAVAFSYAPLHIAWAWLAMGMALAVLTFAGLSRRSQK